MCAHGHTLACSHTHSSLSLSLWEKKNFLSRHRHSRVCTDTRLHACTHVCLFLSLTQKKPQNFKSQHWCACTHGWTLARSHARLSLSLSLSDPPPQKKNLQVETAAHRHSSLSISLTYKKKFMLTWSLACTFVTLSRVRRYYEVSALHSTKCYEGSLSLSPTPPSKHSSFTV